MRNTNFHDGEIIFKAYAGADINGCIKEAIIIALTENRIVRFDHNGATMAINPKEVTRSFWEHWNANRK